MLQIRKRWIGAILLCVMIPLVGACGGNGILSAEGLVSTQKTVTVSDQGFKPNTLTVTAGDTVTFQWFGQNTNMHQVVVSGLPSGTVTSANQRTGTFLVVFTSGGNYTVSDNDNSGFTGTVTVVQ